MLTPTLIILGATAAISAGLLAAIHSSWRRAGDRLPTLTPAQARAMRDVLAHQVLDVMTAGLYSDPADAIRSVAKGHGMPLYIGPDDIRVRTGAETCVRWDERGRAYAEPAYNALYDYEPA